MQIDRAGSEPVLPSGLAVALVIVLGFCLPVGIAAESPVTAVVLDPQESGSDFFVTFAQPFKIGDVPQEVQVKAGGRGVPAQIDLKRRYPDGSVKHAVITVSVPRAEPGERRELTIWPGSSSATPSGPPVTDLPGGFSAEVRLRLPDGSERRADAVGFRRRALAGEEGFRLIRWLGGPLVTEYQIAGPPLAADSAPDPDLLVLFGLRTFEGGRAVRVEVVVENTWVDSPGNIPYDVKVLVGGEEVLSRRNVGLWKHRLPYWLKDHDRKLGHFARARWRRVFWWGAAAPRVHVRHEPSYLLGTGLLPPYDAAVPVAEDRLQESYARWERSPRDLLENGIVMAYFPTTGGREDLGPVPTWTVRYLLTQDPLAWCLVQGTGDIAGSFPVHLRDRTDGRIVSIDRHPGFSLNPRGTLEKIPPRRADDRPYLLEATSPYAVDAAHQPSLAFVPYLLTGDYYYLEEMYFWANWCMLQQNAHYRKKERGLVSPDQTRGEAWALRQLVDAAKMAPDASPEKRYFDAKVRSNLEYYREFIRGPDASPLGAYTKGASDAYVRGRSPEERRKWLTLAPWQQNFLAWSMDHACRAGYREAAAPRDYFTKLQVGVLTRPEDYDPRFGASYFLVVGERDGEKVRYYDSWKELFEKSFRVVSPDTKPGIRGLDYGSSYAYIARAALLLGVRNGVAHSREALKVLEGHLPNRESVLARDPTWALKP